MGLKTRFGANWRQLIHGASNLIARMLFITPTEFPRECRIYLRARRADSEEWLRNRR